MYCYVGWLDLFGPFKMDRVDVLMMVQLRQTKLTGIRLILGFETKWWSKPELGFETKLVHFIFIRDGKQAGWVGFGRNLIGIVKYELYPNSPILVM